MENKTVVDYVIILLNYFEANSIFKIENHREMLGITDKDPDEERAMVLLALQEMEKNSIIRQISTNKKNQIWALYKPLSNVNQQIEISYSTANKIAETINHFCDLFKTQTDFCDPKSVQEKDIRNLLIIINFLKPKNNVDQN
jgi:nicotinamide mononucleotide adenylyltransferase